MKIPLILCPGVAKSGTTTFGKNLLAQKHAFSIVCEVNYFGRHTLPFNKPAEKELKRSNVFNSYNINSIENLYNPNIPKSTEVYYDYMKELWEYAKFYNYPYLFDGSQECTSLALKGQKEERQLFRLNQFFDVKCVILLRHPIWRAWSLANMAQSKYNADANHLFNIYQRRSYEEIVTTFQQHFNTLVLTYEDLYHNNIQESHNKLSTFLGVPYTPSNLSMNVGNYGSRQLSEKQFNQKLSYYKDDFDFAQRYFGYQPWEIFYQRKKF